MQNDLLDQAFIEKLSTNVVELARVMATLRSAEGCPWDREQTLESLKPYVIEEAYEVLDAIESGRVSEHCEELGDLLMQVVFQAEIRRESHAFDLADVARAITDKLVRRHPHVFADTKVSGTEEVLDNWEALKKKEKAGRRALDGVPRALPGLIRALRIGEKAARTGFDFESPQQAFSKIEEETEEIKKATSHEEKTAELGDLLFSVVNYARKERIDPEEALRGALDRFTRRFSEVERRAGDKMKTMTAGELDALWRSVKISST
jgi:tetrapyrrole methylase family protein / MazG family protein